MFGIVCQGRRGLSGQGEASVARKETRMLTSNTPGAPSIDGAPGHLEKTGCLYRLSMSPSYIKAWLPRSPVRTRITSSAG